MPLWNTGMHAASSSGPGVVLDNNQEHWCAAKNDTEQPFLQVSLPTAALIESIKTTGLASTGYFLRTYSLAHSVDGKTWTMPPRVFAGNSNSEDEAENRIEPPIKAKYLKLLPMSFVGEVPCARVEIL